MAHGALLFLFVVAFDGALAHIPMQRADDARRPFGLDGTRGHGYDSMATFGIKADNRLAVSIHADRDLQFIPIPERRTAFHRGRDVGMYAGNLAQRFLNHLVFEFQLPVIIEVL